MLIHIFRARITENHPHNPEGIMPKDNLNQSSGQPDYLKRFAGGALIFIGGLGSVLTSPLILFGAVGGLLTSIITKTPPLESASQGAKYGSLGFISIFIWGIELINAIIPPEEDDQKKSSLSQHTQSKENDHSEQKAETPLISATTAQTYKTETPPEKAATTSSATFFKPGEHFKTTEEIEVFVKKVIELVNQEEAKAEPVKEDNSSKVSEKYITLLIAKTKDLLAPEHDFWGRLEIMTDKDIRSFVSKLSAKKEKGKYHLSELEFLWTRFKKSEFEPSKREQNKEKFATILRSLSQEQLNASFSSSDFLSILNQDSYAEVTANTLNKEQLKLFATNIERHETLSNLIKKLKPNPYLLGKLVAVIPLATETVKTTLINQLSHLSQSVHFKNELIKLAEYYINTNKSVYIPKSTTQPTLPRRPSKWDPVKIPTGPVYATKTIKKEELSEQAFATFITGLNATTFIIDKDKIITDLNSMPDDQIKMIVAKASAPEYPDLMRNLWSIEAKPVNHLSYIQCRKHRLKIILENLSADQLKNAVTENKFWDIFKDPQQPYCKMAAKILTPEQFKTIIANATLENHASFAVLLTFIKKDSAEETKRLKEIIAAIIPYTSPWFALVLELKIKDLLESDKSSSISFSEDLGKYLNQSMENLEVYMKYEKDTLVNKDAISILLHTNTEEEQSVAFTL